MPSKLTTPHRIAVVLGGGGLKGFAHIGALKALQERGLEPTLYAGTSIGSLIAAAYMCGASIDGLAERAIALKRRDLFRINHIGMVLERIRNPAIYLEEPLRRLIADVVPDVQFDDLPTPLLVNTVDLRRGSQIVWGLPGLRDIPVRDAVYASCALPGFFPPAVLKGRVCVDGGVVDNLPVSVAARAMSMRLDAIVAVDVGTSDLGLRTDILAEGFSAIYMRSATAMMHALQLTPLATWRKPPMVLIRPHVTHYGWFGFGSQEEIIHQGYVAATEALEHLDDAIAARRGIFPRTPMHVRVDRSKCIGCGLCVALAPDLMEMDSDRKAFARTAVVDWSAADGDFIYQCPTQAISTEIAERGTRTLPAAG